MITKCRHCGKTYRGSSLPSGDCPQHPNGRYRGRHDWANSFENPKTNRIVGVLGVIGIFGFIFYNILMNRKNEALPKNKPTTDTTLVVNKNNQDTINNNSNSNEFNPDSSDAGLE